MSIVTALPLTTELADGTMATYIFAMGDSRFYTRVAFPAQVIDSVTHLPRAVKVSDIVALGVAIEAECESLLLAVTMSVRYEDDESLIPAGDSTAEYSAYILIKSHKRGTLKPETFQLRIPNVQQNFDWGAFVTTNAALIFSPLNGLDADKAVTANMKADKRARASV